MGEWQAGYVEANGIRLHYTRTGGAGPAVVLAHGVTDDGLCWTPVAEALADAYDLVMVDARGHGRSDAYVGKYRFELVPEGESFRIRRRIVVLDHETLYEHGKLSIVL